MQVWNLGSCYAFSAGLGLFILSTLNAPRALISQIQRVGTHTMWRVQASITLFTQTILSENSAPFMRVLQGSSSLFLAPQGSEEKPSKLS